MELPELRNWSVLVIGLGVSGRSAARWCAERGARVVAADERTHAELGDLGDLTDRVELSLGRPLPRSSGFDLIVPSPGVPPERYREGARRVWGDVELAFRALRVPVVAVTGTNGKSTTVRLIEAMLGAAGLRAQVAGNIGRPALSLAGEPLDAAVLEVSSFQLETTDAFQPHIALILNVTPDHLDRHHSFDNYVSTKARLLARQEARDIAVLNFDDPVVRGLAGSARARVIPFSRQGPLEIGVFLDGGRIVLRSEEETIAAPVDALSLPGLRGIHNLENVLAALAAVWGLGADVAEACTALLDFAGLPHRCEEVVFARGIRFVDDSKATNPGAAARSLESFSGSVVWIAGGRAKGADFEALADTAVKHARSALLIGEAAPALETALSGRIPAIRCESIEEAVKRGAEAARPGDVVLLAPACASFDQFSSFEERGDRFQRAALRWADEPGAPTANGTTQP